MLKARYHLSFEQVRELCIEKNWYTRGTCAQYDALLRRCRHNNDHGAWNLELIEETARDIISHSDPARFAGLDGIGPRPDLEYVVYELANKGVWTFES